MYFKKLDRKSIDGHLARIHYVAYSDQFAEFARLAYGSTRSFVGVFENNELKAFFPVFERGEWQRIAEVPLFIYTEIFFTDVRFVIDGNDFGRSLSGFLKCDVLRLNIFKPYFPLNFTTEGFRELFTVLVLSLESYQNFEDYLKNAISKNARSKIYKGESSDFQLFQLSENDLPTFYNLYHAHVRHLGSTPHPMEYFQKIIATHRLGTDLYMFGVRYHGKLIAANLFFLNKDYLEVKFLADDIQERRLFPNNFLYAEMIKWAIARHVKYIDFGGIPNSMRTNIEFKKSFGAKEYPVHTQYLFKNRLQEIIFKLNRRVSYIKKYPRMIMKKFF